MIRMTRRKRPAPTPGERVLPPVHANAGIEAWYYAAIVRRIDAMERSAIHWIEKAYNPAQVAQDALPASEVNAQIQKLQRRWGKVFNEFAEWMSRRFVQRVHTYTERTMSTAMRAEGFAVKFTQTRPMRDAYRAIQAEQVGLIKSIPQQCLTEVQTLVMRSVARGRDLNYLTTQLQKRFHVTRDRAALIARDQNNKATSTMQAARQQSLGITEGIWKHSHAGKTPRPSHVAVNGTRFTVGKGLYLEGEWVMPGEAINCRCTWQAVIPGLETVRRGHKAAQSAELARQMGITL